MYKLLIDYTECERRAKSQLYDGSDLYQWTNNDSLIDWTGVNRTIHDDKISSLNSTTKPTADAVVPPFEMYQVSSPPLSLSLLINYY